MNSRRNEEKERASDTSGVGVSNADCVFLVGGGVLSLQQRIGGTKPPVQGRATGNKSIGRRQKIKPAKNNRNPKFHVGLERFDLHSYSEPRQQRSRPRTPETLRYQTLGLASAKELF